MKVPGVLQRVPRDVDGADAVGSASLSPRVMTVGRATTALGRRALWTVTVGILLLLVIFALRGISASGDSGRVAGAPVVVFPGDEAKAFAARFARAYLTYSPTRVDAQQEELGGMMAGGLSASDAIGLQQRSVPQRVADVWVARTKDLGRGHGRVTVAASVVAGGAARTVYLAVPVAQDARGGLVVDDYPAPAAPPRRGDPPESDEPPLDDAVAAPITALLQRFLQAYLTGRPVAPEFLAPGAQVAPLGQAYALRDLVSVAQAAALTRDRRIVLATVHADDETTKVQVLVRYRILVARTDDRWLVKKIQD